MEVKAVFFDLDGTLLPMDQDKFVKYYFGLLGARLAERGYDTKQLMNSLWTGISSMVKNDGSKTNEEVFWDKFEEIYGEKILEDRPYIDEFYANEFNKVQPSCGYTPCAKEVIDILKGKGKRLILATNPIFPARATQHRMRWAGLSPEDFEVYTTYENSNFCKPNPKYYMEILDKIGCKPEECVMVGNDVTEDMVAETLGMKVFLLTDCLINKEEKDISAYPHGGFKELKEYIANL